MKNKFLTALLSGLIALGIWLYVVTVVSPNSDKHYQNIPVVTQSEAILLERGLMVTHIDVTTASMHLEGSRLDLNKLNNSNILVTVDVSKIFKAGTHSLNYDVEFPGDVTQNAITVRSISPGTVTVKVEERVSKPVPVDVQYNGTVAENFVADKENKVLDYTEINITGPKSVVDKIFAARIDVDLEGRNESIDEQYSYTLCDDQGQPVDAQMVTTDIASVNFSLKIMRVKEIKLLVTVVDGGGATAATSSVTVEPQSIWVSGSDNLLEGLENLELGTVNLGEIPEDQELTFSIKLPEGITDETGVTEAKVSVKFPELATKQFTVTDISPINVPAGVEVELLTKALEIQVRGPKDTIEALTAESLRITVDFTAAETGTVKLKAVLVSEDPDIGAVGSYTVSATVKKTEG